jgi:hypothetical protein
LYWFRLNLVILFFFLKRDNFVGGLSILLENHVIQQTRRLMEVLENIRERFKDIKNWGNVAISRDMNLSSMLGRGYASLAAKLAKKLRRSEL